MIRREAAGWCRAVGRLAGRVPGHIHFVVQPARTSDIDRHGGAYGPGLQTAMLDEGTEPEQSAVEEFCARVRRALRD
ncbi:hypothetical protein [Streptomyces sp. Je 1-332]|uniref:hypothetical protein n=1 Tax=Streptomyces sp. Je 1-332 TaxID=3231270 RepID=UPI0034599A43